MQEIGRFGLEIHVISNGVEKYVSLMFSKHLVFVDITQFMRKVGISRKEVSMHANT